MSKTRDSLPEPLRRQIEAAALEFAEQVVSAFQQSVVDVTERLAATSPGMQAAAPRVRPAAKASPKPTPKSTRALERRIERVLTKSDQGLGAEQLNRTLGSTTPELTPALQRLMDAGRVAKRGKARGTKYFLV